MEAEGVGAFVAGGEDGGGKLEKAEYASSEMFVPCVAVCVEYATSTSVSMSIIEYRGDESEPRTFCSMCPFPFSTHSSTPALMLSSISHPRVPCTYSHI